MRVPHGTSRASPTLPRLVGMGAGDRTRKGPLGVARPAPARRRPTLLAILAAGTIALLLTTAALGAVLFAANTSRKHQISRGSEAATRCTARAGSLAGAAREMALASAGGVVCLAAGTYSGTLSLTGRHARDVVLQAAPRAHVRTGKIVIGGSHLVLRGLWVDGEVALEAGASFITLDHNDITGGGEGVVFDTSDCTVPNAPKWSGCEPQAPITAVTIAGNRFHDIGRNGSEDAIHLDNWRNVTITGNEFDHIIESGEHTDCLQSVYGGTGLTFTRNYEHDNDCQGFFIKDGDATNVAFTDNLFIRDHEGSYANFAQIWDVRNLTVQRNTIWDGKGLALVANEASFAPTAKIDHNLIGTFTVERPVGAPYAITESENIFGHVPWSFRPSAGDRTTGHPRFIDAGRGDYRLARNRHGIGIDWNLAAQHYGPST